MKNEKFNIENTQLPEKIEELKTMKDRIISSLNNLETKEKVKSDFLYTFSQLSLSQKDSENLCNSIFELLLSDKSLLEIENDCLRIFENIKLGSDDKEKNLIEVLHEKLKDRANIITSQILPALEGVEEKVIDYGAGDGQVTQLLHDKLGLDIEGVDVRLYKSPNITVPIKLFNGGHVEAEDGNYGVGILTNVLHHEKNNEKILDELDRIVKHTLIIIETVPVGIDEQSMEQDKDRTYMNDYLYNRLFHNVDVPVPGTFETPKKWIERFSKHGWNLKSEEDLGFDQPTIKDRHYLFVFNK